MKIKSENILVMIIWFVCVTASISNFIIGIMLGSLINMFVSGVCFSYAMHWGTLSVLTDMIKESWYDDEEKT